MSQHRNPSAGKDPFDRFFRVQKLQADPELVQIVFHGVIYGARIAVFHQQDCQMRLAGVVQLQQMFGFLRWECNPEFRLQKFHSGIDFLHPDPVSLFHQFPHGFRFRIISVAEDMVLPFFIPAGKLYAREKLRVFRLPQLLYHFAAFDGIMVRDGKQADPALLHMVEDCLRRIGSVRNGCMHMQVDSVRLCHTLFLFDRAYRCCRRFEAPALSYGFIPASFSAGSGLSKAHIRLRPYFRR